MLAVPASAASHRENLKAYIYGGAVVSSVSAKKNAAGIITIRQAPIHPTAGVHAVTNGSISAGEAKLAHRRHSLLISTIQAGKRTAA